MFLQKGVSGQSLLRNCIKGTFLQWPIQSQPGACPRGVYVGGVLSFVCFVILVLAKATFIIIHFIGLGSGFFAPACLNYFLDYSWVFFVLHCAWDYTRFLYFFALLLLFGKSALRHFSFILHTLDLSL